MEINMYMCYPPYSQIIRSLVSTMRRRPVYRMHRVSQYSEAFPKSYHDTYRGVSEIAVICVENSQKEGEFDMMLISCNILEVLKWKSTFNTCLFEFCTPI
jgi:hypothetical protein